MRHLTLLALSLAVPVSAQKGGIEPRFDRATLSLDTSEVVALRSGPSTWGGLIEASWGIVERTTEEARKLDPQTGEVSWSTPVDWSDRVLVGKTEDALIFAEDWIPAPPPLELGADGTLRPFGEGLLGENLEQGESGEVLLAVTGREGWRYVLTGTYGEGVEYDWRQDAVAHRLRALSPKGEIAWERRYSRAGDRSRPGAALLAPRRPFFAGDSLDPMTWLQGRLLLLPGPLDALRLLDPQSGEEQAHVDRVWEFRRGFIGPSVWSHYLARFGLDELRWLDEGEASSPELAQKIEDRRTAEESRWSFAVVAGPVVVGHSVFLAVSRAPRGSWESYLAEPLVVELDDELQPVSRTQLPDMPRGSFRFADAEGLVWATDNSGLVRLAPTDHTAGQAMGPGGPDCLSDVRWTRRAHSPSRSAWLTADPCTGHVAFSPSHAFLFPPDGGWVPARSGPYHFPISMIDLVSGEELQLTVSIPFVGTLATPGSNYSSRGNEIRKLGWYILGLGQVRVHGDVLRALFVYDEAAYAVDFDLAELRRLAR